MADSCPSLLSVIGVYFKQRKICGASTPSSGLPDPGRLVAGARRYELAKSVGALVASSGFAPFLQQEPAVDPRPTQVPADAASPRPASTSTAGCQTVSEGAPPGVAYAQHPGRVSGSPARSAHLARVLSAAAGTFRIEHLALAHLRHTALGKAAEPYRSGGFEDLALGRSPASAGGLPGCATRAWSSTRPLPLFSRWASF